MKKYFIPLIIAGIITGCGNKNSAAVGASADGAGEAESQRLRRSSCMLRAIFPRHILFQMYRSWMWIL